MISHGGWGSIAEALSEAIPMVVFPLDGDHQSGCQVVMKAGAGVCLATSPAQAFRSADVVGCLNAVAKEPSFRESCLRIQAAIFSFAVNWPDSICKSLVQYVRACRTNGSELAGPAA